MQKQIYSGVNRVEIACDQSGDFEGLLCERLRSKISEKLGLRTSIIATNANAGQNKLGVIIITPEFDGVPASRIRLNWKNPKPVGPNLLQFNSKWHSIDSENQETSNLDQIISGLLTDIP